MNRIFSVHSVQPLAVGIFKENFPKVCCEVVDWYSIMWINYFILGVNKFEYPTYITLDLPDSISEKIKKIRERYGKIIAQLPVEITLTGSSGIGVIERDQDRNLVFNPQRAILLWSEIYHFSKISSEIRKDGISGCRKKRSDNGIFFWQPL